VTILLSSRSHTTELATAPHVTQSPALKLTVENALLEEGDVHDRHVQQKRQGYRRPHRRFANRPLNALRSSERALNTLNS
jgi:hypothetical protein